MKKITKESQKESVESSTEELNEELAGQLIGDKIKKIMIHYGYSGFRSLRAFAKFTGISSQNVDAVVVGKTKNPTINIAAKVLAAFPEINARWLLLNEPNMFTKDSLEAIGSHPPVDFSFKLEADAALQKRINELEDTLKSKEKIIDLQDQLLAKCK